MFPEVDQSCTYEECQAAADWLLARAPRPALAVVCGSGFGGLAAMLKEQVAFGYEDVPHFPRSTVQGHAGRLVFGSLRGRRCVCMQGRFHLYEGYSVQKVTLPIRVLHLLGVETIILTNAAGGLNQEFQVGDVMVMKDHINLPGLAGTNPLSGPNDPRFGPRFPCMSDAYDRRLRRLVLEVGRQLGLDYLREGVYCAQGGPSFETVAECQMLRRLGADAVGMSTVHEALVARHCGMKVLAMSLITNRAVMDYDSQEKASHQEVLQAGRRRAEQLQVLLAALVSGLELGGDHGA